MVMVVVVGVLVVVDLDRLLVVESRDGRKVRGRVDRHRGDETRRLVVLVTVVSDGLNGRGVYWLGRGVHGFRGCIHRLGGCIYRRSVCVRWRDVGNLWRNGLMWVGII